MLLLFFGQLVGCFKKYSMLSSASPGRLNQKSKILITGPAAQWRRRCLAKLLLCQHMILEVRILPGPSSCFGVLIWFRASWVSRVQDHP